MEPAAEPLIDIDELARQAGRRLEELGVAQANGQVTARPDIRTLRWYTTVGLLDRPIERRGRRAFYGRHHVAQVVAVKRLQADGASLTDIATRLAGLPTAALEAVAEAPAAPVGQSGPTVDGTDRPMAGAATSLAPPDADRHAVPGTGPASGPAVDLDADPSAGGAGRQDAGAGARADAGGRRPRSAPAPVVTAPVAAPPGSAVAGGAEAFWSAVPRSRSVGVAGVLAGVALDPSTTVTFAAPRPLTDVDVEELRRAAAPLLDELRRRGLVPVPLHRSDDLKDLLP